MTEQEAAPGALDDTGIAALSDEVQRRPEKSEDDKGRVGDILYFPDLIQFRKRNGIHWRPPSGVKRKQHFIRRKE